MMESEMLGLETAWINIEILFSYLLEIDIRKSINISSIFQYEIFNIMQNTEIEI